jgi:putative polyhydroxyalkanoate system protein
LPDIHIERDHDLGLAQARKLAFKWAQTAEEKLDMECTYEEGKTSDLVSFSRSGVNGELRVTRNSFKLDARLGFLLGAFKDRIEREIVRTWTNSWAARIRRLLPWPLPRYRGAQGGTAQEVLKRPPALRTAIRSGRRTAAWPFRAACPSDRSRRPTWPAPPCRRSPVSSPCCPPAVACLYKP